MITFGGESEAGQWGGGGECRANGRSWECCFLSQATEAPKYFVT